MPDAVTQYPDFVASWLDTIPSLPTTTERGRRFAEKLVSQWLGESEESADTIYCDGAGDGGIDAAVLRRAEPSADDQPPAEGDTWYLVQSKYGAAFAGVGTLVLEAQKLLDTLTGNRATLNSLTKDVLERLRTFLAATSERDRLVLLYATVDPLDEAERRAMDDVRAMGRERLGPRFDVEAISVRTIYERTLEESVTMLRLPLAGRLVPCNGELLIGAVPLYELYSFLKAYREATGDLDRIYEKNVRQFLGGTKPVNREMRQTLLRRPDRFGLFNNGITIVAADLTYDPATEQAVLADPFIVNGCQTTRTIWDVLQQRLEAGGTGTSDDLNEWKAQLAAGVVVVKLVKVGHDGETMLQEITRYTNTQNAVRAKDFLALQGDVRRWKARMETTYDVYLETQRGAWDSRRAWQRQHPGEHQFARWANAFDLVKVYGAGWMKEPGLAFGKNPPFLPGGAVFEKLLGDGDEAGGFGADDLYAAFLLQTAADKLEFGRGAPKVQRRQTRFLFYMIVIDLLKDVLIRARMGVTNKDLTHALIGVLQDPLAADALLTVSGEALDGYMTQGTDGSVFDEPEYRTTYNNDLNGFLKWEKLGKSDETTPLLRACLLQTKILLGLPRGDGPTLRDRILAAARKSAVLA